MSSKIESHMCIDQIWDACRFRFQSPNLSYDIKTKNKNICIQNNNIYQRTYTQMNSRSKLGHHDENQWSNEQDDTKDGHQLNRCMSPYPTLLDDFI